MNALFKCTLIFLNFLFLAATSASAQNVIRKIDAQNRIDWTRQVIISSGASTALPQSHTASDRINALEVAKANAVQNLSAALFQLNVDAAQTVAEAAKTNPQAGARLRNELEKFTVTDSRSMSDMSVEMDIELPLTNDIMSILLPDVIGGGAWRLDDIPRSPLSLLPWPECRPVPGGVELVIPSKGLLAYGGKPYSSLIIDAGKLELSPALLPKILDETNLEVYGLGYVSKEIVSESGLVRYINSLETAKKSEFTGNEPLVICAQGVSGKNKTDIIVSGNDAVLIHAAAKTHNFLQQAKVVIVMQPQDL